jgi:hypothetical protein
MRIAGIRELRAKTASLLGGKEPLIVTRHGKISGLYLPLEDPEQIPTDLRLELARVLGKHLAKVAQRKGVTEGDLRKDFNAYRRGRR